VKKLLANICLLIILVGCAGSKSSFDRSLSASKIIDNVVLIEPELRRFESSGPFSVLSRFDREITLDLENSLVMDHFFAGSSDKLPVIIISHGNFSNKRAHRAQARHLASWGFHVVSVESPNRDQWLENGSRLKKLAAMLHGFPKMLGTNVDRSKIIFVGHSFGGSAAILATGEGAPVMGAVLLDPAVVHQKVVDAMKKSDIPVALLGSDKQIFSARGRSRFLKYISGEMLEVSVPKSTHDDAQGPSVFSQVALGFDPFTSEDNQALFRSMLTASVIGIASSGTLDFSAKLLSTAAAQGILKDFKYRSSF
jgi:pimeloyl-ACP methyl ester carboxylesterase